MSKSFTILGALVQLLEAIDRDSKPTTVRTGVVWLAYLNSKGKIIMSGATTPSPVQSGTVTGPSILAGQTFAFLLQGVVNPGDTFVEPVATHGSANTVGSTVTLQPSVTLPADGSAGVSPVPAGYVGNFQTAGTFESDGSLGTYDIEFEINGVDNCHITGTVSAPTPESVGVVTAGFVVEPLTSGAPAATSATAPAAAAAAASTATAAAAAATH